MNNPSSQDELPTRSTTNTPTFLETCVLDADYKALEEHLKNNAVEQSDLERCLLLGLQIVLRKEKELSHVAQSLTILLQFGAKWNSDALLDNQKTPYHIICDSSGDHHELLDLMIKSSQPKIINARDWYRRPALSCAVENANINCLKCLIANGADVIIGDDRSSGYDENESFNPIMKTIWACRCDSNYSSVIMSDIFDLLLNAAAQQIKDHPMKCAEYIFCAVQARNVDCIKILIQIGTPLDIVYEYQCVWAWVARKGNVELLKCMFNRGIDKDATDHFDMTILGHVVSSGSVEAVRYLLDLGVAIPSYTPEERETHCEKCEENTFIIADNSQADSPDPCMIAICNNKLEIVKLLDEHGCESCKSFTALRCAVKCSNVDIVFYLLNKYTYPLNAEYIIKNSGKSTFTLLTEPFFRCRAEIVKLLLDHGADPSKPRCAPGTANAIMTAIRCENLGAIVQYIRSGVDINSKSWDYIFKSVVSPLEASVLHHHYYISVMLLISGCSRGAFSTLKMKDNLAPELMKLMKEWNVHDDNTVTPLQQRCRSVILSHLSPRADLKVRKLPLPRCLIEFISIPDLDNIVYERHKMIKAKIHRFHLFRQKCV